MSLDHLAHKKRRLKDQTALLFLIVCQRVNRQTKLSCSSNGSHDGRRSKYEQLAFAHAYSSMAPAQERLGSMAPALELAHSKELVQVHSHSRRQEPEQVHSHSRRQEPEQVQVLHNHNRQQVLRQRQEQTCKSCLVHR